MQLQNDYVGWGKLSKYRTELMGIAIIWIILYHGNEIGMILPQPLNIINFVLEKGRGGVEIFLFLSGIGLFYSYSKNKNLKQFYQRRILRVVIPYFFIATPFWFIQDVLFYKDSWRFLKDISLFSFWTEGVTRMWYFGLLIPCYILFPLIFKIVYRNEENEKSCVLRAALIIAAVIICNWALKKISPDYYQLIEIALTRIPIFILGILCGSFVKNNKEITWKQISVFCILYSYRMYTYEYGITGMWVRYWYCTLAILICFLFAYLFEVCSIKGKFLYVLRIAGAYSMELYIVHVWIRKMFQKLDIDYLMYGINLNAYGILNYCMVILVSCIVVFGFVKFKNMILYKIV